MAELTYRRHIDGLRAVAVLAVNNAAPALARPMSQSIQ